MPEVGLATDRAPRQAQAHPPVRRAQRDPATPHKRILSPATGDAPAGADADDPVAQRKTHYAITWMGASSPNGKPVRAWMVFFSRQGHKVRRPFRAAVYGSELAALTIAQAYRDAALQLLPPQTTHQKATTMPKNNTSGVVGVRRYIKPNGVPFWVASVWTLGHTINRTFSVGRYGEEQAKALALAKREELLGLLPSRFTTTNPDATRVAEDQFSERLQEEFAVGITPIGETGKEEARRRMALLDVWFDQLRPRYVSVFLTSRPKRGKPRLLLYLSDRGWPARRKLIAILLTTHNWAQAQAKAWEQLQAAVTDLHDAACWAAFERNHRARFFATTQAQTLQILDRCKAPDDARLRQPPQALAPLLPHFAVPPLPPFTLLVQVSETAGRPGRLHGEEVPGGAG